MEISNISRPDPNFHNFHIHRKKILLVSPLPPPYSGGEKITKYILNSKISKEFKMIHLDASNKRSNIDRGKVDILNIITSLIITMKYVKLHFIYKPEIVNLLLPRNKNGFLKWSLLIVIASTFRTKIVARLGADGFDIFYRDSSQMMKKYIKYILNRIDRVIVRAHCLKSQLGGLVPEEKIRVVYLPIDPLEFGDKYRTQKDISRNNKKVLYVGRISKAKGALDLLQSIPIIIKRFPNIEFLFVGDIIKVERDILHINNPLDIFKEITFLINKYGIKSYVKFLGTLYDEKITRIYLESDIFILPSYSEGFPFVVLEAMSTGLPVIATRVGALPEVFKDKENILFVETGNPQDIAEKILMLIENPELCEKMTRINRFLIKEKFSLDRFSDNKIAIYNELLKME